MAPFADADGDGNIPDRQCGAGPALHHGQHQTKKPDIAADHKSGYEPPAVAPGPMHNSHYARQQLQRGDKGRKGEFR